MYKACGFRNLGRESCFGRRAATRLFTAVGHVTLLLCKTTYWALLTVIIPPRGKWSSEAPQEVCLLQTWRRWTQIRAFRRATWFSQLVWTYKKWSWRQQNPPFGQWEYFSIWREDFLVGQAEDGISEERHSFWYLVVRRTRCLVIFPKFVSRTTKMYSSDLTFICPCIVNIIPNYNQQDATFLDIFISTDALHASGGFSAHHQEHKNSTYSLRYCQPILLIAASFHLIHDSSYQQYWLTIP